MGLGSKGFAGAVIMCIYLFRVASSGSFWSVYPLWLWIWNFLYLIITPVILALHRIILRRNSQITESGKVAILPPEVMTARLWIFPLLVILFYMHALVLYVSISGVKFV